MSARMPESGAEWQAFHEIGEEMAICNGCGGSFDWGRDPDGKWLLMEPIGQDVDMDRVYVDENGMLRADHRDRHPGGKAINAARLDRRIPPERVADEAPLHRRVAEAARLVVGRPSG